LRIALEGMSAPILDRSAFILAHTRLIATPLAPEIHLRVADEATDLWQKTEDELGEIGLPPPFWAFAWAGGQGLARHILDHPDLVAGRRVLDFASGSGLVAIAAAKAGAAAVEASEIDAFALAAIGLNAAQNGASVRVRAGDLIGSDEGWDVVLAGDVSYQQDMAEAVTRWLGGLSRRGAAVLIGDPWRSYLARDLLEPIAEYEAPVTRALEDAEIKRTGVFRFR
jgi:predicted nicotinamide N-methyase